MLKGKTVVLAISGSIAAYKMNTTIQTKMQNEKADCANEKQYRIKIFVHICHTIKSVNK